MQICNHGWGCSRVGYSDDLEETIYCRFCPFRILMLVARACSIGSATLCRGCWASTVESTVSIPSLPGGEWLTAVFTRIPVNVIRYNPSQVKNKKMSCKSENMNNIDTKCSSLLQKLFSIKLAKSAQNKVKTLQFIMKASKIFMNCIWFKLEIQIKKARKRQNKYFAKLNKY